MTGVFKFVVHDDPGHEVTVTDYRIEPLDLETLTRASGGKPIEFKLSLRGARVTSTRLEFDPGSRFSVSGPLADTPANDAYALVQGGWLPPGIVPGETVTYLLDRNVVAILLGQDEDGRRDRFTSFLDVPSVILHPICHALESPDQSELTPAGMAAAFADVSERLSVALPNARQVPFAAMNWVHGLKAMDGLIARRRRAVEFLIVVAPLLRNPVSRKRRPAVVSSILEAAAAHGVEGSLPVLACLSTALVANGQSPARGIIKPDLPFGVREAYNAASDFMALDLLATNEIVFPSQPSCFLTADRNLARYWVGLAPHGFRDGRFDVFVRPDLFPNWRDLPASLPLPWRTA